jgi:hypothetical protein
MVKLFPEDKELMRFLGVEQESLFPDLEPGTKALQVKLKDKGQREGCGCAPSKDIGHYSTCMHLCKYCYANLSEAEVRKNLQGFQVDGESIVGD